MFVGFGSLRSIAKESTLMHRKPAADEPRCPHMVLIIEPAVALRSSDSTRPLPLRVRARAAGAGS
jgi:hypothetical protein